MTGEECKTLSHALAVAIREASATGKLAGKDLLLSSLKERGIPGFEEQESPDMEALLAQTLATHRDLAALTSITGETLYHSPTLLSRTYASILDRKGSPVVLIAEEVRMNSAQYPRPIPPDLFERAPFDLSPAEIEAALKCMAMSSEFQDISFTTTSTGAVYLFSTRHLERPYAAFLAERADTGLLSNP